MSQFISERGASRCNSKYCKQPEAMQNLVNNNNNTKSKKSKPCKFILMAYVSLCSLGAHKTKQ